MSRLKRLLEEKESEKGIRTADDVNGSLAGIPSNYLDLAQLEDYWSPRCPLNHHTEATSMRYAQKPPLYRGRDSGSKMGKTQP